MPNVHFAATRKVGNLLFGFRVRIQPQIPHASGQFTGKVLRGNSSSSLAMSRGVSLGIVCFAAMLAWPFVTSPDAQLDCTRPVSSHSTGVLSNQGAGESHAGKRRRHGSGQNSSGEAADIEKKRDPVKVHGCTARANSRLLCRQICPPAAMPRKAELQKLPAEISSAIGGAIKATII
jgi:hypothetical protein